MRYNELIATKMILVKVEASDKVILKGSNRNPSGMAGILGKFVFRRLILPTPCDLDSGRAQ